MRDVESGVKRGEILLAMRWKTAAKKDGLGREKFSVWNRVEASAAKTESDTWVIGGVRTLP